MKNVTINWSRWHPERWCDSKLRVDRLWCSIVVFLTGLLVAAPDQDCFGGTHGIRLQGDFNVTSYSLRKQVWPALSSSNAFEFCYEAGGKWRLIVFPRAAPNDRLYLSFDGTNSYYVKYVERFLGAEFRDGRPVEEYQPLTTNGLHPATIFPDEYPIMSWDEQERVRVLWLCLASGGFLKRTAPKEMPLVWENPTTSLLSYGFQCDYVLDNYPPFAPTRMIFTRAHGLDLPLERELDRPLLNAARTLSDVERMSAELENRRKLLPNGFVVGRVTVDSILKTNGFGTPSKFLCELFLPAQNGSMLSRSYRGEVKKVEPLPDGEALETPILSNLSVLDERFRYRDSKYSVDGISYKVAYTDPWPSSDSPKLQSLFQQSRADKPGTLRYHQGTWLWHKVGGRAFVLITICLTSVLGLLFIIMKSKKAKGV